ncbi:MAG: stage III sporulation protein AD [Oscillospiraceae bacterium]|nr:stage III sporulation protein AD [Oscillospiraceae bacterium]
MKIVSIAGICITASVMCKLFSESGKEYALYIKLAAAAAVMSMIIIFVSPIAETIRNIYSRAGADEEYLTVLFKALGICYITQFACDICKDSGENALATQAELAGKISLMVIALPLFESLANIVARLI